MTIVINNDVELKQYNITGGGYGVQKYHFPDDVVINFPVPKDSLILADRNVQIIAVDSSGFGISKIKIYSKDGNVTFTGDVSKVEVVALNGAVNFAKIGDSEIYAKSVAGQDVIKGGSFSMPSKIYAEESVRVDSLLNVEVRCKGEVNCKGPIPESRISDPVTVYAAKFNGEALQDEGISYGKPVNKFDGNAKITYDVNVDGKKRESEREFTDIDRQKLQAPARQAAAEATSALDEAFKLIDARLKAWGEEDRKTLVTQAEKAVREGVSKNDFIKGRDEKREAFKQELVAQLDKVMAVYQGATADVREWAEKSIKSQREHISMMVDLGKNHEQGYYDLAEKLVRGEKDLAAMKVDLDGGTGQNEGVTSQMKALLEGLRAGLEKNQSPAAQAPVDPKVLEQLSQFQPLPEVQWEPPTPASPTLTSAHSVNQVEFELVDSLGRCGRDPSAVSSLSILVIGKNTDGEIGVYSVVENNLPVSNSPLKAGIKLKGVFDSESVIINRGGKSSIGYQKDGVLVEFDPSLFSSFGAVQDSPYPSITRPTPSEVFTLEMKIPGDRDYPKVGPRVIDEGILPMPAEQHAEFIARDSAGHLCHIKVKELDATGIKAGSECRDVQVVGQKLGAASMDFTPNGTTFTAGLHRYTELTPSVVQSVNEVQQGGKSAQVSFDR